jgi:LysM repeat protein/ABC-type branched-subunit amino acid transport system substrate-binding protein
LFFVLSTLLFTLSFSQVYGQEKATTEIHKTKSSAIINGQKYYLHTVEKGQTLFAIAKFYNRELNDIVIDNPEAIDGINPGQVLRISVEKRKSTDIAVKDTANVVFHKVEKGQTLYSITKQYGVSQEKLQALNPELKDGLKVGTLLKIPVAKPKAIVPVNTLPAVTPAVEKIEKSDAKVTYNTVGETADHISTSSPITYVGEKKETYNIAFFLPFHAEEANSIENEKIIKGGGQFSNKTSVALQFYEGALLAIDSLKKMKLNAKIFVYDIDDRDSLNVLSILKKPELATMNLLIGPLYGASFVPFANFAKEHHIAIVSPFTQVNKILFNNPYVSKVSPSVTLQVEQMAHFVVDTFKNENIILVNNSNAKEISFFNAFKNTANADLVKAGFAVSDTIKVGYGLGGVQSLLSLTKINVIVLPSNNQSYVTEFLSKLNNLREKYKIVLFGLQNWINYDNLDFEYLNNLSLHIPSNLFIDYTNVNTKKIIKAYRDQYKTEPDSYVFQGFDITYCFLNALLQNGTGFLKNLPETNYHGIGSHYSFSQFPSESGFENKFVYILKYQDYQLIKAN